VTVAGRPESPSAVSGSSAQSRAHAESSGTGVVASAMPQRLLRNRRYGTDMTLTSRWRALPLLVGLAAVAVGGLTDPANAATSGLEVHGAVVVKVANGQQSAELNARVACPAGYTAGYSGGLYQVTAPGTHVGLDTGARADSGLPTFVCTGKRQKLTLSFSYHAGLPGPVTDGFATIRITVQPPPGVSPLVNQGRLPFYTELVQNVRLVVAR